MPGLGGRWLTAGWAAESVDRRGGSGGEQALVALLVLLPALAHAEDAANLKDADAPVVPKKVETASAAIQRTTEMCIDQEIADRLTLTHGTVKLHVTAILKRLGVRNRSQAAAIVVRAERGVPA